MFLGLFFSFRTKPIINISKRPGKLPAYLPYKKSVVNVNKEITYSSSTYCNVVGFLGCLRLNIILKYRAVVQKTRKRVSLLGRLIIFFQDPVEIKIFVGYVEM